MLLRPCLLHYTRPGSPVIPSRPSHRRAARSQPLRHQESVRLWDGGDLRRLFAFRVGPRLYPEALAEPPNGSRGRSPSTGRRRINVFRVEGETLASRGFCKSLS